MPPLLAAVLCYAFVGYLYWRDRKSRDSASISWIPMIWAFLAGSRYASTWLSLSAPRSSLDNYAEGSPTDRAVFFALIILGAITLYRRPIAWGPLLMRNKWLALYLLYCLISVAWAPEQFVLIKRWIKDLGNPIMALVLLTEARPYRAVGLTLKRLSFVFLPVSVLFIKYFPHLGRAYHNDGTPMYTGIGHQKNDLGLMCLMAGLFFSWKILQLRRENPRDRTIALYEAVLIAMLAWLLTMSDSKTSFTCLLTAIAVFAVARIPAITRKPARIIPFLAISGLVYAILDANFQVKDSILIALGRDPTLTNRTEIWELLLAFQVNSMVGAGFMSFWTGDRLEAIWSVLPRGLNQAHNGYIEQYLNLGYIGVGFILVIMFQALLSIRRQLRVDAPAAMLRLAILMIAALYNYTEASFYGMNNAWLLLLIASIDVSVLRQAQAQPAVQPVAKRPVSVFVPSPALSGQRFRTSRSRFQRSAGR